jgi:uncharacterized protein YegJ (DUF2314 family)
MGLLTWLKGLLGSETPKREREEKPLIALVLFLAEPRDLDADFIARRATYALGERVSAGEPDGTDHFVAGEEPSFVLKYRDYFFLINSFSRPYMDDPETSSSAIGELRLRKAVREHTAWLSVDLLGEVRRAELPKIYRVIGKLVAALADEECLAVFAPATGQLNLYDAESAQILRGDKPLELFDVANHPPVVPVSGDDPRLKAAVSKARKRWQEFVSAFEERRSEQNFSVKARIGDDEVAEFMWLSVTGLENGWVYGRLDNDPIELTSIRCGDRVRIHIDDLNDWLYTDGDQVRGGFTIEVLRKIQEEL